MPAEEYSHIKRQVKTLGDVLGKLGGTFASLKLLGAILVGFIAPTLYESSLIRKFFYFKPKFLKEILKNNFS